MNDLDAGLEGVLSNCVDDAKLGRVVESRKGREALRRDLERLEGWAINQLYAVQ